MQFEAALSRLSFTDDEIQWMADAIKLHHADKIAYHETHLKSLQANYNQNQMRIDNLILDQLDRKFSPDLCDELHNKLRLEQERIREAIRLHEQGDRNYVKSALRILELAKNAVVLYRRGSALEKRKIISFVLSNAALQGGKISDTYKKPFNWIVEGLQKDQWLGRKDSNL